MNQTTITDRHGKKDCSWSIEARHLNDFTDLEKESSTEGENPCSPPSLSGSNEVRLKRQLMRNSLGGILLRMVEEKQAKGLKVKNELKRPDTCLS